ncbi:zinc finger BED domain-containing protein RICESLEEPER 2-like [Rhizophagus clarus]|uniref:Zinc finger BED domain-containing protein RICESLEEPER 2-like n=1 Tax=Rhizophagus clarus TaxID=94130 RepID=A0A8H3R369_9GLOM|nr:zinc finger BED domain-containing protein RICESLEEPER 2-like [Rhizophagus clarus]
MIYLLRKDAFILSADTVKNYIMIFYEDSHKKIALILQNTSSKISFTIDIWTSSNNYFFLEITAYWVTEKNDEISNEEVGSLIRKLRTLVKKIKVSPQQKNKFKAQCKAANIPNLNVMLDVHTRWNSTYDMLVKVRKLKEPLNTLSNSDPTLRPFTINEKKWVHLLKIEELLKISELYKTLYAPQETQNTNIEYNSSDEDLVSHIFKWRCIELVSEFDRYLKADQAQALCDILNWWKVSLLF